MFGVVVNAVAILVGTLFGIVFKRFIPERILHSVQLGIGFATIALGLKMSFQYHNVLLMIVSVALGGALGTAIHLEKNIEIWADKFRKKFAGKKESQFAQAFTLATVLYCTGAMAIIGSINAGLRADYELLYTKSILDGIFSITLGAIYGIGIAFSAFAVLLYQGTIVLLAGSAQFLTRPETMADLTSVGGILITMIGMNITGIKKVSVGDFLPAVFIVIIAAMWVYV